MKISKISIFRIFLVYFTCYYSVFYIINIYFFNLSLHDLDIKANAPQFALRFFIFIYLFVLLSILMLIYLRKISIYFLYEKFLLVYIFYIFGLFVISLIIHRHYIYTVQDFITFISFAVIYFTFKKAARFYGNYYVLEKIKIISFFSILLIIYLYFQNTSQHTSSQVFLLLFSIVLFKHNKSLIDYLILICLFFTVFMSNSRGTLLGLVISLLMYLYLSNSKKKYILLGIFFILFFLFHNYFSILFNRIMSVSNGNELAAYSRILGVLGVVDYFIISAHWYNWLFGFGLGEGFKASFETGLPIAKNGYIMKIENTFFIYFLKTGIFGVVLYISFLILFFKKIVFYLNLYRNDYFYKGLYVFFIIEVISMLRVDSTGDNFFIFPLIMIVFSNYFTGHIYSTSIKKGVN